MARALTFRGRPDRLETVSKLNKSKPEVITRDAIAARVAHLEWEAKALREGERDLQEGRTISTVDLKASLSAQRNARASRK